MTNIRIAQLLLEEGWNLHVSDDPAVAPVMLKMTKRMEFLSCPVEHDEVIELYSQGLIMRYSKIGVVTVYVAKSTTPYDPPYSSPFTIWLILTCVFSGILGFIIARFWQ